MIIVPELQWERERVSVSVRVCVGREWNGSVSYGGRVKGECMEGEESANRGGECVSASGK